MPFPWFKYGQVVVRDFVAGGMENVSLTALADYSLHTTATENIVDSDGLISHEMAHQWFGDLVTCKDWSQIWLNEGFATFYADLYNEHKHGPDADLYAAWGTMRGILGHNTDTRPIVNRKFNDPDERFDYLVPYDEERVSFSACCARNWAFRSIANASKPTSNATNSATSSPRMTCANVIEELVRPLLPISSSINGSIMAIIPNWTRITRGTKKLKWPKFPSAKPKKPAMTF